MSQKEWFALALRILGAMKLIEAFDDCIAAYDIHVGLFKPQMSTVGSAMNHAAGLAALGFISCALVERSP